MDWNLQKRMEAVIAVDAATGGVRVRTSPNPSEPFRTFPNLSEPLRTLQKNGGRRRRSAFPPNDSPTGVEVVDAVYQRNRKPTLAVIGARIADGFW